MMDDEPEFPSDGSPSDLKPGGYNYRVWKKIDDLCQDVSELKTDIAFIKGKIEGAEVVEDRSFQFKSGAKIAVIGACAGLVPSLILYLTLGIS
jgi:hypothetical protein